MAAVKPAEAPQCLCHQVNVDWNPACPIHGTLAADVIYEYKLWVRRMTMTSIQIEEDLTRLSKEFGWRCVGFMPTRPDGAGFFLMERPVKDGG